jgi:predicted enzyme related to lactoylglutathione lyase
MIKIFGLAIAIAVAAVPGAFAQQAPAGLLGVKIAVQDFDRATRFYSVLGMTPGIKYNAMEQQLRWVEPARGAPVILVKDEGGRVSVVKGGGYLMIAVADAAATIDRLKAAGFAVTGEPHRLPQATVVMIKDPDGNSIELLGGPFGSATAAPAH